MGDQIDSATQKVFDIELNAKVAFRSSWSIESDQDVNIAVVARLIASDGTKKTELHDAEAIREGCLVRAQQRKSFVSAHGFYPSVPAIQPRISQYTIRSAAAGGVADACQLGQPHAVGLAEGRQGVRRQRMVADGVLVARQPLGDEGLQLVFGRRIAG